MANYADVNTPYAVGEKVENLLKTLEREALNLKNRFKENYLIMNLD